MRLYEGLMVFDPSLSHDSINDGLKRVESLIQKGKGTIEKQISLGKKGLGYEVKKKRNGIAHLIYFKSEASALSELNRQLRLFNDLLKFSIFKAERIVEEPVEKKAEEEPAADVEMSE